MIFTNIVVLKKYKYLWRVLDIHWCWFNYKISKPTIQTMIGITETRISSIVAADFVLVRTTLVTGSCFQTKYGLTLVYNLTQMLAIGYQPAGHFC